MSHTSSVKSEKIESSIARARLMLGAFFVCAYALSAMAGFLSLQSFKRKLAHIALEQAEQDLAKGDYRKAIIGINLSLANEFEFMVLQDESGKTLFNVPPILPEDRYLRATFTTDLKPQGFQTSIGSMRFAYDITSFVTTSFALFIVLTTGFYILSAQIEKNLRRRHNEILERERAFSVFSIATQVSHDIRSPLSALNLVVRDLKEIPDERRQIIEQASIRINSIANDLLAKSKSQVLPEQQASAQKARSVSLSSIPIGGFLKKIFEECQAAHSTQTQIAFKLDLRGPQEDHCEIDENLLGRVISNLVNNAVEAIDGTGEITLALRPALKGVAIVISDTGKGIPADVLKKLGSERVTLGKTGSSSGTGIGVLHASRTIQAMNGTLQIQSRVGMGAIVTLILPRHEHEVG